MSRLNNVSDVCTRIHVHVINPVVDIIIDGQAFQISGGDLRPVSTAKAHEKPNRIVDKLPEFPFERRSRKGLTKSKNDNTVTSESNKQRDNNVNEEKQSNTTEQPAELTSANTGQLTIQSSLPINPEHFNAHYGIQAPPQQAEMSEQVAPTEVQPVANEEDKGIDKSIVADTPVNSVDNMEVAVNAESPNAAEVWSGIGVPLAASAQPSMHSSIFIAT